MAQWKYSIAEISADLDKKETLAAALNEYGNDGWEVVTVWPQSSENKDRRLLVLLKRQASLEEPTK